ncbi:MAG: selenocysteine lyase [Bradyrhizobium sp.]|nr:selenocysteine lyase [Bradyrhizobium sp.]
MALVSRSAFPATRDIVYFNGAQKHPLSLDVAEALGQYLDASVSHADGGVGALFGPVDTRAAGKFALLINAAPNEIAYAPSTTAAESMILAAMGLPRKGKNIVTDALHYDGSVYLYEGLAAAGFDIRRAPQREGAIDYDDLERLIDDDTALVAVSLVSFANGFQHDLISLCAMAHTKGALVYADIIQAAGAIPIDVKASGVDFCASGTHKWLMGDKGVAFLYVRAGLFEEGQIARRQFGRRQFTSGEVEIFRPPDKQKGRYDLKAGAAGMFEVGNLPMAAVVCVDRSMDLVARLGVTSIAAHAACLAARLRSALPRLGYQCLSPSTAPGHISAFAMPDAAETTRRLAAARIQVRMPQGFMRVSVGVYNDLEDVEKLVRALS